MTPVTPTRHRLLAGLLMLGGAVATAAAHLHAFADTTLMWSTGLDFDVAPGTGLPTAAVLALAGVAALWWARRPDDEPAPPQPEADDAERTRVPARGRDPP